MNKGMLTIVIVGIVVIFAVYWYAQQSYEPTTNTQQESPADVDTVSADNSVPAIEEELNATALDNLDTEFNSIDTEINAALKTP